MGRQPLSSEELQYLRLIRGPGKVHVVQNSVEVRNLLEALERKGLIAQTEAYGVVPAIWLLTDTGVDYLQSVGRPFSPLPRAAL